MYRPRRRLPPFRYPNFPIQYGFQNHYQLPRQFPEVDTTLFVESAKISKPLLTEIVNLLDKIEEPGPFSKRLMDAAQRSDQARVRQLLREAGVKSDPEININPDGLRLTFLGKTEAGDFSRIMIVLRWG
ncbi:hypothetical protein SAMN05877753_11199 [Bacillus oleivorans]|uniref:Uncharacterized protein n=1 Tax=Bacillus oleivorans TaxID=1448271 RepID=A0A285D7T3_9BACI|nr:hypothetical protein [Bacillus oleivorans]SNX75243.1 hypothetical protein SAMN05877753_11199 [Bacillus oleivorans]